GRAEQLVAVHDGGHHGGERGQRRGRVGQPQPPREQPGRACGTGQYERVERLEGPDQRQAQQQSTATEKGVCARRIAVVVVRVYELAVGVAQVEVGVVLAVVDQEVRADHVDGGVAERYE